jgi:hypothetical protein
MTERLVVVVGKEKKEIPVITSVVTRSSKFFQAAMKHDWKEAQEQRVPLPDTKVHVFEGYLQWLYTSDFTFTSRAESNSMSEFFILGDFLEDLAFRNAVLDWFEAKYLGGLGLPNPTDIQLALDHTPPSSMLQQLFSEMWSSVSFAQCVEFLLVEGPESHQYPREFVRQQFERLMSVHALRNKKGTKKTDEQVIADFQLKRAGGAT